MSPVMFSTKFQLKTRNKRHKSGGIEEQRAAGFGGPHSAVAHVLKQTKVD